MGLESDHEVSPQHFLKRNDAYWSLRFVDRVPTHYPTHIPYIPYVLFPIVLFIIFARDQFIWLLY